eukprot:TRINITY_DN51445_c0_g1_i1.p1 TRINITY_DN51445_c0_g1~~TRINITY_DN51445_c0_g1_i1.p1  ORF type:complete len:547 (+),score=112.58 TRINITY_DN51445_c0_g1_i1:31-1671(+)
MSINSGGADAPSLRSARRQDSLEDVHEESKHPLLDGDGETSITGVDIPVNGYHHQHHQHQFHQQRSRKVLVNPTKAVNQPQQQQQSYQRVPVDSPEGQPQQRLGSSKNLRSSNSLSSGVAVVPNASSGGSQFPFTRAILFTVFILLAAGEIVLRRLLAYSIWNYRWIVVQLQCAGSAILFTFLAMINCYQGKYRLPNEALEDEDEEQQSENLGRRRRRRPHGERKSYISISKHTVIALLDLSQHLMLFIPAGVVPGYGSAILPHGMIVLVLMGLCIIGKGKVRKQHAAGSVLAIIGIIVIWNQILDGCGDRSELFWNAMVLVSGGVPAGMSIIYKSIVFTEVQADLVLFNMVSGLLQTFLGFVLSPIGIASQYLGSQDATYEAFDIFTNMRNGIHCVFFGENFVSNDQCDGSRYPWNMILFIVYFVLVFGSQAALKACLSMQDAMVAGQVQFFEIESTYDLVAFGQVGISLIAFIVFWIPPVRNLTADSCFAFTVFLVLGSLCWAVGHGMTSKLTEPPTIFIEDDMWSIMESAEDKPPLVAHKTSS